MVFFIADSDMDVDCVSGEFRWTIGCWRVVKGCCREPAERAKAYNLGSQPAKQVEAFSLGWSEASRAQPQDKFITRA